MGALSYNRSVPTAPTVAALRVYDCEGDVRGVIIPRPEVQLVLRVGPAARNGLDVHACGARETVHRKLVRSGQRTVAARLRLDTTLAVFGVPASAMAGRIISLEELWGGAAARRLCERLAGGLDAADAAAILERAIAERLASAGKAPAGTPLALAAADRLARANVGAVAAQLGVSERHLRRVFREAVGVSPKVFAKLARFRRALRAARRGPDESWASIAAASGYYDQAHLIAEFRAIAGVTPRALLDELRASLSVG